MLCTFLMIGDKHCKLGATKNSKYCKIYNYNVKKREKFHHVKNVEKVLLQSIRSVLDVVHIK